MAVPSVCLLPQRPGSFTARTLIIHDRAGAAYAHAFLATVTATATALTLTLATALTLTLATATLACFLGTALSSSSGSSFFDTPLV